MRSENVGPITFNNFLEPFGSAAAALDTLPDLIRHGGAKRNKIAPLSAARQKYETIQAAGVDLVARGEDRYPHLLAQVEDAPRSLLVRGFVRILNTKPLTLAICLIDVFLDRRVSCCWMIANSSPSSRSESVSKSSSTSSGSVE